MKNKAGADQLQEEGGRRPQKRGHLYRQQSKQSAGRHARQRIQTKHESKPVQGCNPLLVNVVYK